MADITRKSPTYPRIPLQRAIELSRRIYDAALNSPIDTSTALNLMGFQGESGPSRAALASLKQFGLVEGRDQAVRITPLAESIHHPMGDDEQRNAIVTAADNPSIYQAIRSHFAGRLPSDPILKAYLLRNHGFSGSGSEVLVKLFRETESYVSPHRSRPSTDRGVSAGEASRSEAARPETQEGFFVGESFASGGAETSLRAETSARGDRYVFKISKTADAELILRGKVTSTSLEKLARYIDLMKDDFPHDLDAS